MLAAEGLHRPAREQVRILPVDCWLNARSALSRLGAAPGGGPPSARHAALLPGRGAAGGAERQAAAAGSYHRGAPLGEAWRSATTGSLQHRSAVERTAIDPLMRAAPVLEGEGPGGRDHAETVHEAAPLPFPRQPQPASRVTPPQVHAPTKELVLASRCEKQPPGLKGYAPAGGDTKPLDLIAPADGPWPVNCAELPELCEVVKKVAVGRAVMAAVLPRPRGGAAARRRLLTPPRGHRSPTRTSCRCSASSSTSSKRSACRTSSSSRSTSGQSSSSTGEAAPRTGAACAREAAARTTTRPRRSNSRFWPRCCRCGVAAPPCREGRCGEIWGEMWRPAARGGPSRGD